MSYALRIRVGLIKVFLFAGISFNAFATDTIPDPLGPIERADPRWVYCALQTNNPMGTAWHLGNCSGFRGVVKAEGPNGYHRGPTLMALVLEIQRPGDPTLTVSFPVPENSPQGLTIRDLENWTAAQFRQWRNAALRSIGFKMEEGDRVALVGFGAPEVPLFTMSDLLSVILTQPLPTHECVYSGPILRLIPFRDDNLLWADAISCLENGTEKVERRIGCIFRKDEPQPTARECLERARRPEGPRLVRKGDPSLGSCDPGSAGTEQIAACFEVRDGSSIRALHAQH